MHISRVTTGARNSEALIDEQATRRQHLVNHLRIVPLTRRWSRQQRTQRRSTRARWQTATGGQNENAGGFYATRMGMTIKLSGWLPRALQEAETIHCKHRIIDRNSNFLCMKIGIASYIRSSKIIGNVMIHKNQRTIVYLLKTS